MKRVCFLQLAGSFVLLQSAISAHGVAQPLQLISGSVAQPPGMQAGGELMLANDQGVSASSVSAPTGFAPSATLAASSSIAFTKWNRYPAEERDWIDMPDTAGYYRDVLQGALTYVSNPHDGEEWYYTAQLPNGSTITSHKIWYYSLWTGQNYQGSTSCSNGGCFACFVAPTWYVCGAASGYIQWWAESQCASTGAWLWDFYDDNAVWHSGVTSLAPTIPPNKVPKEGQVDWPFPYDSLCFNPIYPKHPRYYHPCAPGETNRVLISDEGCFLTALTMVLEYHGVTVNPFQLNQWLIDHNGFNLRGYVDPRVAVSYANDVAGIGVFYRGVEFGNSFDHQICAYGPQVTGLNGGRHWVTVTGTDLPKSQYVYNDAWDKTEGSVSRDDITGETHLFAGPLHGYTELPGLDVWFFSPGELVVTDPLGRRVGYDPDTATSYTEIPGATYSFQSRQNPISGLEDDDVAKTASITSPVDGTYSVVVRGTGVGSYSMEVRGYDVSGDLSSDLVLADLPIDTSTEDTFQIDYARAVGSVARLAGGFSGGGQRPRDVNLLLSYGNITSQTTTLPAGTTSHALTVLYGEGVNPSSFSASLNGVDVTGSFHPAAGSGESITLPLARGSNLVILAAEGTVSGKPAADKDRLVFKVP